ncbi:MAG: hypothetical protein HRU12_23730 [Phaeodactylibacter sp.]|nr:hypothetical protein [Phaeodactylibacter sp.]
MFDKIASSIAGADKKTLKMNFRIAKYDRGFVVEVQKRTWYGRKYWTHFVSVAGIESRPWFFSSYDLAMTGLLDEIKLQTIRNSR